jgi:hypothetical protein
LPERVKEIVAVAEEIPERVGRKRVDADSSGHGVVAVTLATSNV